jgi:hypothetical protein
MQRAPRMSRFACSPLSTTFDQLQRELLALDRAWHCERERASLRHAASDIRHHVCAALAWLDDLPPADARYDALEPEPRVLAHEAFLSVLALGQLLVRAVEDRLAPEHAIEGAHFAVDQTLDMLSPFVSSADDALRRVLLEDVPVEDALAVVASRR